MQMGERQSRCRGHHQMCCVQGAAGRCLLHLGAVEGLYRHLGGGAELVERSLCPADRSRRGREPPDRFGRPANFRQQA